MRNILTKKRVLITAGPTMESIDPVRYVSNHSSGKMGYAIAEQFLAHGAEVILVSGPVNIKLSHPNLSIIHVNTAMEMDLTCCRFYEELDIAVFAAAVSDYRPESISDHKIKKDESSFSIKMVKNVDIAYEFGKVKLPQQISVGFVHETNDEIKYATGKMNKKNFDMVVLNSKNADLVSFGFDTNKIKIIKNDLSQIDFPLKNKLDVAEDIVSEVAGILLLKNNYDAALVSMTA